VPNGRYDIVRLDLAGWTSIASVVQQWRDAIAEHDDDAREMSVAQFNARLEGFLSGHVPLWTPVHRGVQVLEALAAAYRSFDHIFLAGMKAGAFPKGAPTSPVLSEAERDALAAAGLPLERRAVWDQLERELFRVLVAGARKSFVLSYARLDDAGREVIGSAFVEELGDVSTVTRREIPASQVVLPGMSLYRTAGGPRQALHVATIERDRRRGVMGPYNGRIEAPDLVAWLATEFGNERLWSPSQLEDFAKCPWAYFSKRLLRLEKLEDVDEDIDAATRGSLLHAALKEFYDSASAHVGGAVFLREPDKAWARELAKASIASAIASYADKGRLGHPALRDAKRSELERIVLGFLEWEIQLHEDMLDPKTRKKNAPRMVRTAVESHELAFTDMIYEHDGVRIRYRGSIDRVEVSNDDRVDGVSYLVVADYKSSESSTPGGGRKAAWQEGVVLQVPLYAHALMKLRPTSELARAGYLTLKKPWTAHVLELVEIDRKSGEVLPQPDVESQWTAALHAAIDHVKRARSGAFPANPPGECTCPSWCHGRDICRIPGGPVSR
jgi:ATP-dependent helicase/DNAse subunit B